MRVASLALAVVSCKGRCCWKWASSTLSLGWDVCVVCVLVWVLTVHSSNTCTHSPAVATATTSFLVLFTSSSAALQFLLASQLDYRLGLWYFGVGLLAALAGQFAIDRLLQRFKRRFVVVFLLAAVIIVSGVVMFAFNVTRMARGEASFAFGSPCAPAS